MSSCKFSQQVVYSFLSTRWTLLQRGKLHLINNNRDKIGTQSVGSRQVTEGAFSLERGWKGK